MTAPAISSAATLVEQDNWRRNVTGVFFMVMLSEQFLLDNFRRALSGALKHQAGAAGRRVPGPASISM
jgi:hypothetical protein